MLALLSLSWSLDSLLGSGRVWCWSWSCSRCPFCLLIVSFLCEGPRSIVLVLSPPFFSSFLSASLQSSVLAQRSTTSSPVQFVSSLFFSCPSFIKVLSTLYYLIQMVSLHRQPFCIVSLLLLHLQYHNTILSLLPSAFALGLLCWFLSLRCAHNFRRPFRTTFLHGCMKPGLVLVASPPSLQSLCACALK